MSLGPRLPNRGLVEQDKHAVVERPDVARSRFTNRTTRKQTQNAAELCPFFWDEVVPGDMLKYDITAMIRMSTPIHPMFSNVSADVFLWFVPDRIVWTDFERFMGEQNNPSDDVSALLTPSITFTEANLGSAAVCSIADYLGVPIQQLAASGSITVNSLVFRAFDLIYDEWFRDQNLIAKRRTDYTSTADTAAAYIVAPPKRAKSHDRFTSALPWTQKFVAPTVPIAGSAPVLGIGFDTAVAGSSGSLSVRETGNPVIQNFANWRLASAAGAVAIEATSSATNAQPLVFADLSAATGVSINSLRQAVQIQRLLERDARAGTRYVESVLGHWGIRVEDYRASRPEYIGGGQAMVEITPVAQTTPVAGVSPLGNIGAAATGVVRARGSYAAREHGRVIGILCMRPEQAYQQGLDPKWFRRSRLDYPWPALMQLGEQAVLRRELYVRGDAGDTTVFGYIPRYEEFRQFYSDVAGRFRSTVTTPLDVWHLAERFTSAPVLGQTFVEADNLTFDRVLSLGATARTLSQQFICDILVERDFTRPFPMFGTPMGLGRF